MAKTIDEWRLKSYTSGMMILAEDKGSRLVPHVTQRSGEVGTQVFLEDQLGQADDPERIKQRAQTTPHMDVEMFRTAYMKEDFQWGSPFMDDVDNPTIDESTLSAYEGAGARAIGRQIDRLIFGTAWHVKKGANVTESVQGLYGVRYTGENGVTPVTFPTTAYDGTNPEAAYVVPVNHGGSNSGLTPQKLVAVQEILGAREIMQDGMKPRIAITVKQVTNLKNSAEFVHGDIAAEMGRFEQSIIDEFEYMGFHFVRSQQVPKDGNGYRRLPVWFPEYLVLGTWIGENTQLLTHSERSGAQSLLTKYSKACTRVHEEGFVEIKCLEA